MQTHIRDKANSEVNQYFEIRADPWTLYDQDCKAGNEDTGEVDGGGGEEEEEQKKKKMK